VTAITYVVDDLRVGGAQTHLTRLVQELSRRGHALEVVCMGPSQPAVTSAIPVDVPVASFRLASVRAPDFAPQLVALVAHLRRRRPEVVHTYLNTAGVFGLLAARVAGVPHVVTSRRDIGIFRSGRIRSLEAFLSRRWADRVFCVCEAVARAVRRDEGIPEDKLRVLLNGIDVTGVAPRAAGRQGPVRFGIVAAVNRVEKGHREFVEAAALASRGASSVEFHVVGDGPLRPGLEARAAELGIGGQTVFHGERRDILAFLDTIDVLVVPSYTEGISNAALEAMAKGLPVIATGVDGNLETVDDGTTGLLVPPRDPEALARAMERYAADPTLRSAHGRAGRERLDRLFTVGRMADRYEEEYAAIVGRARRPRIALVESSSGVGGTAKYVRQLVDTLDGCFETVVLARASVGWYRGIEARAGQAIFFGGRPGTTPPSRSRLRTYAGRASDLLRMLPRFLYYRRRLRSLRVDLVHTNNNVFEHVPVLAAARSLGLPSICHLHDQVPLTRIERMTVGWPDRFFVLSRAAQETYGRDVPAAKLRVVHNGLILKDYEAERLPPASRTLTHPAVGLVGRLVSWKGHETVVRAMPRILAEVPSARFYFIGDDPSGDGSTRERLVGLAGELGCAGALELTGWVDDPRALLAQLDVSVVPSTSPEPFGLVILESMALGVPVVASRHGGPLDIINNDVDGLFHEPGDSAGLAAQVVRLLIDGPLADRLSAAAKETVTRRFSMEAVAAVVAESYSELLGPGPPAGGHP
jgi:glycosyltransferase involved in cell wall biosynthesis